MLQVLLFTGDVNRDFAVHRWWPMVLQAALLWSLNKWNSKDLLFSKEICHLDLRLYNCTVCEIVHAYLIAITWEMRGQGKAGCASLTTFNLQWSWLIFPVTWRPLFSSSVNKTRLWWTCVSGSLLSCYCVVTSFSAVQSRVGSTVFPFLHRSRECKGCRQWKIRHSM